MSRAQPLRTSVPRQEPRISTGFEVYPQPVDSLILDERIRLLRAQQAEHYEAFCRVTAELDAAYKQREAV